MLSVGPTSVYLLHGGLVAKGPRKELMELVQGARLEALSAWRHPRSTATETPRIGAFAKRKRKPAELEVKEIPFMGLALSAGKQPQGFAAAKPEYT